MSAFSAHSNQATNLFISGLDEVIDPVVVRYRPAARNRGGVTDLIRDAGLRDVLFFESCKV